MRTVLITILLLAVFPAFGWERTFFEDDYSEFLDLLILPDTTLAFLTNFTFSLRTGGILFTDCDGDSLDVVSWGGEATWERIYIVGMELIDDSTRLAIGGYFYRASSDSASLFIMITDLDGDSLSFWAYDIIGDVRPRTFDVTPDNCFMFTGTDLYSKQFWVHKVKRVGSVEWTRIFDFGVWVGAHDLAFAKDSTLYLVMIQELPGYIIQPMFIHMDTNGDTLRCVLYDYSDETYGMTCQLYGDSLLYVFGAKIPTSSFHNNLWAAKYDTAFNLMSERVYDFGYDVWATYYSLPYSDSQLAFQCIFDTDIGLVNFDLDEFDTIKTSRWERHGTREFRGKMVRHPSGDIIVATTETPLSGAHFTPLAIRVDSLGNDVPSSIEGTYQHTPLPAAFSISAYPNPFNSAVTIALEVVGVCDTPLRVEIFDVNGRRVSVIGNYDQPVIARRASPDEAISYGSEKDCFGQSPRNDNAGEFSWTPAPSLPSGVYLVRASVSGETITKRVVYLK